MATKIKHKKKIDQLRERGGKEPKYYEVFARKDSHSDLSHVGSVEAPNDQLAQVRAWYIYDQHNWREMCVIPPRVDHSGHRGRQVRKDQDGLRRTGTGNRK